MDRATLSIILVALLLPGVLSDSKEQPSIPEEGMVEAELSRTIKPLWLPVNGSDCTATCAVAGMASVNGGSSNSTLCSIPKYGSYWYEGVKRNSPSECQVAYPGKVDLNPEAKATGYFCGCLPHIAGPASRADGVWVPRSNPCPPGYQRTPYVCRVKEEGGTYIGWASKSFSSEVTCMYYHAGTAGIPEARESPKYHRLCGPESFAYVTESLKDCLL